MARAEKEREGTLPETTREPTRRQSRQSRGRQPCLPLRGPLRRKGPRSFLVVEPRRKWAAPCVVFGCPLKHDPTDSVKMSSRHRLRIVRMKELCQLCLRHIEDKICWAGHLTVPSTDAANPITRCYTRPMRTKERPRGRREMQDAGCWRESA
jgi:hypothetical protein